MLLSGISAAYTKTYRLQNFDYIYVYVMGNINNIVLSSLGYKIIKKEKTSQTTKLIIYRHSACEGSVTNHSYMKIYDYL